MTKCGYEADCQARETGKKGKMVKATSFFSSIQDRMMVEEVKLRRKYLNEGDVFILDLGLHLIQV